MLSKPERNDFIVYSDQGRKGGGNEYSVHRLCGMPGDTLLIKEGVLYVNGQNMDKDLQLMHMYRISATAYKEMNNHGKEAFSEDNSLNEDSIDMLLADKVIGQEGHLGRRLVTPSSYIDERVNQQYHQPWNPDNFGPLVVPSGSYFVLADNRNAFDDSRFKGFVPINNWLRTVVGH